MTRRTRLLVVLGLALVVGGVMVARQPRAQFGWVAYMSLSEVIVSPTAIVLNSVGIAALVLAGLGVALIGGAMGYALGRRTAPGMSGPPADGAG